MTCANEIWFSNLALMINDIVPLLSRTSRGSPICCLPCCPAYGATMPAPTWLSSCYVWIITTISRWPGDNWAGKGSPRQTERETEDWVLFLRRLCGQEISHQIYLEFFLYNSFSSKLYHILRK